MLYVSRLFVVGSWSDLCCDTFVLRFLPRLFELMLNSWSRVCKQGDEKRRYNETIHSTYRCFTVLPARLECAHSYLPLN